MWLQHIAKYNIKMNETQDSFLSDRQLWLLVGILVIFSLIYQALAVRHTLTDALDRMETVGHDLQLVRDSLHQTQHTLQLLLDQSYQRQEDLQAIREHVGAIDSQYNEQKLIHQRKIRHLQEEAVQKDKKMLSIKKEASQFDY